MIYTVVHSIITLPGGSTARQGDQLDSSAYPEGAFDHLVKVGAISCGTELPVEPERNPIMGMEMPGSAMPARVLCVPEVDAELAKLGLEPDVLSLNPLVRKLAEGINQSSEFKFDLESDPRELFYAVASAMLTAYVAEIATEDAGEDGLPAIALGPSGSPEVPVINEGQVGQPEGANALGGDSAPVEAAQPEVTADPLIARVQDAIKAGVPLPLDLTEGERNYIGQLLAGDYPEAFFNPANLTLVKREIREAIVALGAEDPGEGPNKEALEAIWVEVYNEHLSSVEQTG